MMTERPIRIAGMGTYLPNLVTSSEIEARYNIRSGYSEKNSGVSMRYHVTHESNGYMGARAAEEALKNANIGLDQIDMLISAGGTYDYPIPNQASIIKSELNDGEKYDFAAIDVDSTCLSFVAALSFVSTLIDGDNIKNVLIVSSEIASKGLNTSNWETTTLFGDGAAAAVLSYDPSGSSAFIKGMQKTYSEGVYNTIIEGGGNQKFFKDYPYDQELHSFKMNGIKLLRMAKQKIPIFFDSFFSDLPMEITDIKVVIPHQASKMGLHIFEKMYDWKENQLKRSLGQFGNCIAASIPLTMAYAIENGEIERGDLVLLCGTSAGFSIGASLFKY